MFRLLKFLFEPVIGEVRGFQLSMATVHGECAARERRWTGPVCVTSEVYQ